MHILYLHQYFCPPGGIGNTRALDFARQWARQGHQVTVLTSAAYFPAALRQQQPAWEFDLEPGLRVHVLDIPYAHMMGFSQRIRAFLAFYRGMMRYGKRLAQPDLIYASSTPPTVGEAGRRLARHWQIPFVFETVDVWPDVPEGMGILRNRVLLAWLHQRVRRIYTAAAHIVCLSEGMRDQVLSHAVAPDKVSVLHNGTDVQAFPYTERPDRATVTCIYAGTVGIANGLDQLLYAAKAIALDGHAHIRFRIIGAGNDLARVQACAQQLQLTNVSFEPGLPKEEVPALLHAADIGIVCFAPYPVLAANSANKWYDYLASGLPVVTNYTGWQADYIRTWNCGLSAPQGDVAAFAAQIVRLAGDAALRREMGLQGRRLAETHFDRAMLADRLMGIFETVRATR
jgi:glycosyltransferase involved in cell wall biosynthesis